MTRFIVLRHGETEWNIAARMQGHRDSALTAAGIAQAEALARRLQDEPFDVLVSSDLGRALETARRIAARTGHAIVSDARFRERNLGAAEGLTYDEFDLRYPDPLSPLRGLDSDRHVPGGETLGELYDRARAGFEALAREHEGRSVAVVCHGGVLRALYRLAHGIPVEMPHRIPIPNASYNVLRSHPRGWDVETWGDTAHLAT